MACGLVLSAILALASPSEFAAARARLATTAQAAGLTLPLPDPALRVYKRKHLVELWSGERCVARYPAGLGHRGLAEKRTEGDHLTPEGEFRVCTRNENSAFHLFLGISYPGPEAARKAHQEGRLSKADLRAILNAENGKRCPPWNTRLGGKVGLHGGGSGSDWTWGCIAVENDAIEELWLACPVGTPVRIVP